MQDNLNVWLERILRLYGHDILLQRRIRGEVRGQYGDMTGANYANALEPKLYRFTVRHIYPRKSSLATRTVEAYPEGIVRDVDLLYYFPGYASPGDGDRVYENDGRYDVLNSDGSVMRGIATYLVDWALPMRGKGGKVVYWITGVTRENPN